MKKQTAAFMDRCRQVRWLEHVTARAFFGLYAVLASLFLAGCASVCIVDSKSRAVIVKRDTGTFREEPLYVREDGYATLKRTETNSFVCKYYGFDGKVVSQTCLPLLFQGYGGDEYAFSDRGDCLAYIERYGHRGVHKKLRVCLLSKPFENLIRPGVCDDLRAYSGYKVFWIDPSTILLYAKNAGECFTQARKEDSFILHLDGMRVSQLPGYYDSFHGPVVLSPSRRYLLASETMGYSLVYRLHIVDLKVEKEIEVITPVGERMPAFGAVWGSDNEVVYAVDGVIYTQTVGSPDKREVFRMKPKRSVWLYAVDSQRNLHYQMYDTQSDNSKEIGGWRTHNLDTHEDRELTGERVSGRVLMTGNRDKIVTTVGF